MPPPSTMPFSVTDILQQPADVDASASYKRSMDMAQALTGSSTSSPYSIPRPSNNPYNSTFGSSTVPNSYYGSSSNSQYYDYGVSFPNAVNTTGQYSPTSCWYGPAASMCGISVRISLEIDLFYFSVSIFSWLILSDG